MRYTDLRVHVHFVDTQASLGFNHLYVSLRAGSPRDWGWGRRSIFRDMPRRACSQATSMLPVKTQAKGIRKARIGYADVTTNPPLICCINSTWLQRGFDCFAAKCDRERTEL